MSTIVAAEVKRRLNVSGGLYTLALEIADTANHNGECIFKSAGTLAALTRQGKRTVHRQIKKLRALGWLVMIRRKHSAKYPVPLYAISADWLRGASLATLPDLNLQSCHPEPPELPTGTRRVATSGNQSVLTHHKKTSSPDVTVNSARGRASPTGSPGAIRKKDHRSTPLEPAGERLRKARTLMREQPDYPAKSLKRMFRLSDEQLAKVQTS